MPESDENKYQLFQRVGSSNWSVRFSIRGEGQVRKSLGTTDEAEARRKADKLWRDATYRSEHGLRAVQRTFEQVAEEFIEAAV